MRTRVKFCGITRPEDGVAAGRLGADAIGLVFYPDSPRAVSIEQAQQIVRSLPPFVSVVGLFVDAQADEVEQVLRHVAIDVLQFHGHEPVAECERYGRAYIKALRMHDDIDVITQANSYASASAILLDSYQAGVPGGTGQQFDWQRIPAELNLPLILAGGLSAANVAAAIESSHPYAVDVSGGIEKSKGIKDQGKMAAFINEVQRIGTS